MSDAATHTLTADDAGLFTEPDVLAYFSARYGRSTGARVLWLAAHGGTFAQPESDTWETLWKRSPSTLALVREALFDEPGQALLLEHLMERAELANEDLIDSALMIRAALDRQRGLGFQALWLRPVIAAFEAADADEAFAALTPAFNDWLGRDERDALLAAVGSLVAALEALRGLRALLGASANGLSEGLAAIDLPLGDDALCAALREGCTELILDPNPEALLALLAELDGPCGEAKDESQAALTERAAGLSDALWASRDAW
jgi:hypothetical protein